MQLVARVCQRQLSYLFQSFWNGITGRNSLYTDNGDRLLLQIRSLTTAIRFREHHQEQTREVSRRLIIRLIKKVGVDKLYTS